MFLCDEKETPEPGYLSDSLQFTVCLTQKQTGVLWIFGVLVLMSDDRVCPDLISPCYYQLPL